MDHLAGGRYRLDDTLDRRQDGGLFRAVDTRLGRTVLVQCDADSRLTAGAAGRLVTGGPWLAPLLDGGEDTGPDGRERAYTVYPDSAWIPVATLTRPQRRRVRLIAAPDTDQLLVDPEWLAGRPSPDGFPAQWLPSPSELDVVRPLTGRRVQPVGTFPTPFREEVA